MRMRVAAGALAIGLALAGCATGATTGSDDDVDGAMTDADDAMAEPTDPAEPTDSADSAEPTDDAMEPPADGPLAFTATDVNGAEVDVASFAGEPVVLWFWAPWCTICRGEAPDVADVAAELEGDVTFLGVAGRGPVEDMLGFIDDTGVEGFQHLADVDGALWQRFGVTYQPAYAFVAADGTVDVTVGALGADGLTERAQALIG
jgi:thiol-disulfide isomerase/thioredoxin